MMAVYSTPIAYPFGMFDYCCYYTFSQGLYKDDEEGEGNAKYQRFDVA